MQIGILETGHAPDALAEFGDYPSMFRQLLDGHGFTFRTWPVVDMAFPESVHDADGWLLTGSRHGAYEDLPFIAPLETFLRQAYAAHVPLVGICFGHQIIAQALGGKVEKSAGGLLVGPQDYDFEGTPVVLNAWHQDQVTRLPEDARRIGSSATCENAALIYGDRAYSVQAHPEFGHEFLQGLLRTRGRETVSAAQLAAADARRHTPLDSPLIADRIAEFFTRPRG